MLGKFRIIASVTDNAFRIQPRDLILSQRLSGDSFEATLSRRIRLIRPAAQSCAAAEPHGEARSVASPKKERPGMKSRIALSIAPILMITLGQQAAHAASSPEKPSGHTSHSHTGQLRAIAAAM
jgi:hypothetical protein